MAINLLLNRTTTGKIGTITLDCTISDDHEYANEVTQFPVENGADISDHIRQIPEDLTIEGFIANSPVKYMDVVGYTKGIIHQDASMFTQGNRVNSAFEKLLEYAGFDTAGKLVVTNKKRNVQIIDIETGLRMYTGMIITRLKISRNSTTGDGMQFSISFKKLNRVNIEFLKILHVSDLNGRAPRATKQATDKVDKAKQSSITTTNSSKVSLLRQALNKAATFSTGGQ
jgi:hypothetical protein